MQKIFLNHYRQRPYQKIFQSSKQFATFLIAICSFALFAVFVIFSHTANLPLILAIVGVVIFVGLAVFVWIIRKRQNYSNFVATREIQKRERQQLGESEFL